MKKIISCNKEFYPLKYIELPILFIGTLVAGILKVVLIPNSLFLIEENKFEMEHEDLSKFSFLVSIPMYLVANILEDGTGILFRAMGNRLCNVYNGTKGEIYINDSFSDPYWYHYIYKEKF